MSTAAPQALHTVGASEVGATFALEYRTVDMLATVTEAPDPSAPNSYPTVQGTATYAMHFGYGLTPTLDFEVGAEGALYGVVPWPSNVWAGLRHQVFRGGRFEFGVAGRAGYGGFWASRVDDPYEGSTVGALFGAGTVSAQLRAQDGFRPRLALNIVPMRIVPRVEGADVAAFNALATSLTLVAAFDWWLAPFVSAGVLTSDNVRGTGPVFTVGLVRTPPTRRSQGLTNTPASAGAR